MTCTVSGSASPITTSPCTSTSGADCSMTQVCTSGSTTTSSAKAREGVIVNATNDAERIMDLRIRISPIYGDTNETARLQRKFQFINEQHLCDASLPNQRRRQGRARSRHESAGKLNWNKSTPLSICLQEIEM